MSSQRRAELRSLMGADLGAMRSAGSDLSARADSFREQTMAWREELKAIRAQIDAERREDAARNARAEEEVRRGEYGRALQEVQRRIDRRETTMPDVLSGADTHWSAVEVRRDLVTSVRRTIDELEEEDPEFSAAYRQVAPGRQGHSTGDWSNLPVEGEGDPGTGPGTGRPADGGQW